MNVPEDKLRKADAAVDRAADRLQETANRVAGEGGLKAKLAEPLAEDAAFLRRLKPTLVLARIRGEAPTDGRPAAGQLVPAGTPKPPREGGPNPFLVLAGAFALGILLARLIDWRSHAHPRL